MRKARTGLNIPINTTQVTKNLSAVQISLVVLLTIMIIVMALPGYLSGKWTWSDLPKVPGINQVKSIETKGLDMPGWQNLDQRIVNLGNHKWSVQIVGQEDQPKALLYLLPQNYYRNHPEIEWVDVDGSEKWQKEQIETLDFTTTAGNSVRARFFKAWNAQAYAVVQWYASPKGGDYQIFPWFWQDQLAQIKGTRVPWVAVSLKIPMSPLDQLQSQKALAQKIAESIQNTLEEKIFRNSST